MISEQVIGKSLAFIALRAITIKELHAPRAEGTRQLRVVRPRTLSTCVLGRTHVRAKAARAEVGRSPRTIDSRARVGQHRSLARSTLSRRSSTAGRARARLARTYLESR